MKKPHIRSRGHPAPRISAIALPLALLLTACAGSEPGDTMAARGCPDVSVLRQVETMETTTADGASAVVAIQSLSGECAYSANDVTVDVDAVIAGQRESGAGSVAPASYFVAVVDPEEQILNKRVFNTEVSFDGATGTQREQLRQVIPLPNPAAGMNYQVVIGFQP